MKFIVDDRVRDLGIKIIGIKIEEIDNISKTYAYSEDVIFITLPRISVTIKIPRLEWGTLEIIRNRNNLNEIEIFEYLEAVRLKVKERNEFNRTLINIL